MRLGHLEVGWAKLAELREALARIQAAGKPVIVYFDADPRDAEYYLASAADWIVCPPVSVVGLNGLRAEATLYKGVMDKLGVAFEFERVGKYKSAVEPFSQTSLSDAAREARDALLDDVFAELTSRIAAGRKLTVERVIELVNSGPHISVEAKEAGLVDQIAYEDELDSIVREQIARHAGRVHLNDLARREYHRHEWGPIPKVAVVFAEGTILSGRDRTHLLLGRIMGAQTIVSAIRAARNDPDVKAVVLRIDSPGGLGVAADVIWREVKRTIGVKPLVVSMSDAAASAAYYIACPADSIFASPATVTGSIGVFAGKISLAGLYEKIGINKETAVRGEHADMYSDTRSFTEQEREIVQRQMSMFYDHFLKIVAEGRRRTPAAVDSVAQGRVWSGADARANGLVDAFGGLPHAISSAAAMAGIGNRRYEVSILPRASRTLSGWLGSPLWRLLSGEDDPISELSSLADEHIWYLLPWRLDLR